MSRLTRKFDFPTDMSLREKIAQLIFVRIGSNLPPVRIVEQDEERVLRTYASLPQMLRPMVLGRMSVEMLGEQAPVVAGERYVVLGRHVRTEGRKTFTTSALYGPSREPVASAEAVWISVDPAKVLPASTR